MSQIKLVVITFLSLCGSVNSEEIDIMVANLLPALIQVESNGDSKAIGDKGKAFGQLQIWKCVVDDVNRIAHQSLVHHDAFDRQASQYMAVVYLTHYGKHYTRTTGLPCTYEVLARMWNGGPYGYTKDSTKEYWAKVMAILYSRVGM